jgi:DNA-binding transcriptional ArsR family regulator
VSADYRSHIQQGEERSMNLRSRNRSEPADPWKPYRGQAGKTVEERLAYALTHRTRLLVLTLLNEGMYTVAQLVALTDESRDSIKYHIKELLDAEAIELAKEERQGKSRAFYYRAVEMPTYSVEELEAMAPEDRQAIIGLTLQSIIAEALTSFWAGKMQGDPKHLWLGWRWFNLDARGRTELADEMMSWWHRVQEIQADSINRCAESGEPTESVIVSIMGFLRERNAPEPPAPAPNFTERPAS